MMILLAKLFGIYFKNFFMYIDEFILQVPGILDICQEGTLITIMVYHAYMEDCTMIVVS